MMCLPDRVILKQKSKMTGDCGVFKLLQRSVEDHKPLQNKF